MNNNIMNSAYTDNVLLPSVTSIYFYDIINPGHLVAIHPSVSWKLPTWPTGHSNIFHHIPTTWPPSRAFLLADLGCSWKPLEAMGSHWKPLLVGGMSHPPMESTYELFGIIPPNRGGGTYAKKSEYPPKKGSRWRHSMEASNGQLRWTLKIHQHRKSR